MTVIASSRLGRTVFALALVGTLAACGESAASSAGPAPGPSPALSAPADPTLRMISHQGRRLAFHVTAGDQPAIVLDAGGGEDSSYWKGLVPQLAEATGSMIVTYDRAGLGGSDEVPGPWDPRAAVADLRAGLDQLGVTRDVTLVSHSQAGEVATYLVQQDPTRVSGAVLVDANLPEFFTDEEIARLEAATKPQIEGLKSQPSTKQTRQLLATAASFVPVHQAYHKVAWPKDVPATVVVSQKTPFDGSPEDAQRWRDAAAAFVAAGTGRQLVTAEGSSHDVALDRPDLVLAEIRKMADR